MKPQKLRELLDSLLDHPLGFYGMEGDVTGWHGLTTKQSDAIRNALAYQIRRKNGKGLRTQEAGYREQSSNALSAIANILSVQCSAELYVDVPNAVAKLVERIKAFNAPNETLDFKAFFGPDAHQYGEEAIEALRECAELLDLGWDPDPTATSGKMLAASVPYAVEKLVAKTSGQCSTPEVSEWGGPIRITWVKGGETFGIPVSHPGKPEKLSSDGTWVAIEADESVDTRMDDKSKAVAVGLRRGEVDEGIVPALLDDAAEALRNRKAAQS